jgi:hypothetical protein
MMKLSFLSLLLLLAGSGAFSQEKTLPMDESGKYTFLEVAELPLVSRTVMAANARRFFKSNSKSLKLGGTEKDSIFYGTGKMIIQKTAVGIGHPSGDATYTVNVALRDGKYRLILSDFILTPYERDRYSNYVPGTMRTPLETEAGKLNKAEWEANMAAVALGARKLADKLKLAMGNTQSEARQEAKKPAVISTKNW